MIMRLYVCQSVHLLCIYDHVCVCQSVRPFTYVFMTMCVSVSQSIYLCTYDYVCMNVQRILTFFSVDYFMTSLFS